MSRQLGITAACATLGLPRSSYYRAQAPAPTLVAEPRVRPVPPRALSPAETTVVRETLDSTRFQDCPPREVYATLLDEGTYLCSWPTMYRILRQNDEVRERRNQVHHPAYAKPERLATGPNQLWSWDITQLRGPVTWTYFHLYVIMDVYSRYVVGWLIAERESEALAQELIQQTCAKQNILPGHLTIHADNGSAMIAKSVAQLLIDLGVVKSHSRPHVSDDNPYSEAQFKTMKYRPDYPERFGCLTEARAWAQAFFTWYNHAHHHIGIGLLTPAVVHAGQAPAVLQQRGETLHTAYAAHPERFVKGPPAPEPLPPAVWINPPRTAELEATAPSVAP